MHSFLRAASVALALPMMGGVPVQQAPSKLGYVNTAALMEAAPGRAAAESLLTKTGDGYKATLQKLQDSAQAQLAKYQKEEPKLTQAQKDKANKELEALDIELRAKQQQFTQQFQAKQNEVMAPITDLVKKVIDDIREEGGYAMIFANDPQTSPIVAADKNLDITDKVVSRLHATAAPKAKAAETTKGAPAAPAGVTGRPPKPPT